MRRWSRSEVGGRTHSELLLLACGWLVAGALGTTGLAQDAAPVADGARQAPPIGQFLSLPGTLDDVAYGRVSRAALALQARAREQRQKGILVLEVVPGSSPFHQVQGLAKFLTSEVPALTTVAWIPQTVTGNHVVLALACQEIVMDPDASLGDISLGTALDQDERTFVINMVGRRHNRQVNEALALGLLDRQKDVLWVQVETGEKPNATRETRIVSRAGYDDLARSGAQILDVKTIKEAGAPGVFTAERARAYGVLAMHVLHSREEIATLYHLPREAMREDYSAGTAPRAIVIRIDDMIEPILEQFVLRQIDRAAAAGVNLMIFEIESPGGYLRPSENLAYAIADLENRKIRTVAFVPRSAYSGAAIIALGCDEIYLTPEGIIGDAGPIEIRKGQQFELADPKILNPLRENLKILAERKHRPAALAMAMADKDLQVFEVTHRDNGQISYMTADEIHDAGGLWIQGRLVPEAGGEGKLLTVNGRRAHVLHLAETPVRDFDELKSRLGVPAGTEIPVSARTWVDTLIYALNSTVATVLLFLLGIMCIYLELHFPSGLFGILACVCFGVFFWSRFLGGTAGWLEVVLFLLGVGCLAVEVFLVPGFGVFGVSGVILCVLSLILASQTFVIPTTSEDVHIVARSFGTLCGGIVGTVVLAALLSRYLPSIPLFNEMILTPPGGKDSPYEPHLRPELAGGAPLNPLLERDQSLVGKRGTSMTLLRPAGKAQIGEEFVDVISDGPFVPAGRAVEVVAVTGNRVVVRELS